MAKGKTSSKQRERRNRTRQIEALAFSRPICDEAWLAILGLRHGGPAGYPNNGTIEGPSFQLPESGIFAGHTHMAVLLVDDATPTKRGWIWTIPASRRLDIAWFAVNVLTSAELRFVRHGSQEGTPFTARFSLGDLREIVLLDPVKSNGNPSGDVIHVYVNGEVAWCCRVEAWKNGRGDLVVAYRYWNKEEQPPIAERPQPHDPTEAKSESHKSEV